VLGAGVGGRCWGQVWGAGVGGRCWGQVWAGLQQGVRGTGNLAGTARPQQEVWGPADGERSAVGRTAPSPADMQTADGLQGVWPMLVPRCCGVHTFSVMRSAMTFCVHAMSLGW
jgi:hypothetical protein